MQYTNVKPYIENMLQVLDENNVGNPDQLDANEQYRFEVNLWMLLIHTSGSDNESL